MDNEDYEKILELFQAGQYVLAQQLIRKHVNGFTDWLADKIIQGVKDCTIRTSFVFINRTQWTRASYIHVNYNWISIIQASYDKVNYNNFYTKTGRITSLLRDKKYNKVKQKLKGVLKTLLLSAIHNKLN